MKRDLQVPSHTKKVVVILGQSMTPLDIVPWASPPHQKIVRTHQINELGGTSLTSPTIKSR
jgi:hypothetical protein